MQIDVCNGDADGLCAVLQWRLHAPCTARLVTGLKRDIALLAKVRAHAGDGLLVCDVSMRRNLPDLKRLLNEGVRVQYFDHHAVDTIPDHPLLEVHINTASDTCTSLLVDEHLRGKFRAWAVVGAFGDNLTELAQRLAHKMGATGRDTQRLRQLGESINYNAYGDTLQDVYIAPEKLFDILLRFPDPLELLDREWIGQELEALRRVDLQCAATVSPCFENTRCAVYVLPDAAWSRRVLGSWINQLAAEYPARAHAVLRAKARGDYVVSVRAPQSAPEGAVQLCRAFGGDGRNSAAGIDLLPAADFKKFLHAFATRNWSVSQPGELAIAR
jgi:hypothetical protein